MYNGNSPRSWERPGKYNTCVAIPVDHCFPRPFLYEVSKDAASHKRGRTGYFLACTSLQHSCWLKWPTAEPCFFPGIWEGLARLDLHRQWNTLLLTQAEGFSQWRDPGPSSQSMSAQFLQSPSGRGMAGFHCSLEKCRSSPSPAGTRGCCMEYSASFRGVRGAFW